MLRRLFSAKAMAQTLVALLLVGLCLVAAQWQWNRGQVRSHQNSIIAVNQKLSTLVESSSLKIDPVADQWRLLRIAGEFDQKHLLLLRNRYSEGRYGFEVLTIFRSASGSNYWVDRGWVPAGASASTPPTIPSLPEERMTITTRIRSDNISRQIEGSLFAIPGTKKEMTDLANTQGVLAAPYYVDLISSSAKDVSPLTQITLPELNNGPHFAYALQWLAFATLILVGRYLLFRETQ